METLGDFPKLYCPFIRQTFQVDEGDFRRRGRILHLRKPEVYLVVDRINRGYSDSLPVNGNHEAKDM